MPRHPKPHHVEPVGERPRSDTLVMFGASGDLAHKKLFPAVYRLQRRGLLDIPVIGVALDDWTDQDLVNKAEAAIREDGEEWDQAAFDALAANLRYVSGNYAEPRPSPRSRRRSATRSTRSSTSPSRPRCSPPSPAGSPRSA